VSSPPSDFLLLCTPRSSPRPFFFLDLTRDDWRLDFSLADCRPHLLSTFFWFSLPKSPTSPILNLESSCPVLPSFESFPLFPLSIHPFRHRDFLPPYSECLTFPMFLVELSQRPFCPLLFISVAFVTFLCLPSRCASLYELFYFARRLGSFFFLHVAPISAFPVPPSFRDLDPNPSYFLKVDAFLRFFLVFLDVSDRIPLVRFSSLADSQIFP